MNQYALTVLIHNSVSEDSRAKLLDAIKSQFGKLIKEDLWGKRNLSYPINHQNEAFYAHYEFESDPATISPLDKSIKHNEDIIRYLLVRND